MIRAAQEPEWELTQELNTELPKLNETHWIIRTPQEPRRGSPSHESDESNLDNVLPRRDRSKSWVRWVKPRQCSPQKPRRDRPTRDPSHESEESNLDNFSPETEKRQTHSSHESEESNLDNVFPRNREETGPSHESDNRWVKTRQCSPQKPRRDRPTQAMSQMSQT